MRGAPLIVVDPEICAGKPVVRGTRVPIEYIVRMARNGNPPDRIADEFDLPAELVKDLLQVIRESTIVQFA